MIRILIAVVIVAVALVLWRRDKRRSAAWQPPARLDPSDAEKQARQDGTADARYAWSEDSTAIAKLDEAAARAGRGDLAAKEYLAYLDGFASELHAQKDDIPRDMLSEEERRSRQAMVGAAIRAVEAHRNAARGKFRGEARIA